MKTKKFTLVLSGGSALGLSHLGTLKYLNEQNYIPNEIIGTSMGAIIAALYATNNLNEDIEKEVSSIGKWIGYNIFSSNFIETNKIEKLLKNYLKDLTFKDIDINLKIVATDLHSGEPIEFSKNNNCKILDAVLASMAIPGVFPIKNIDDNKYVDGFVSMNLPVEYATNKVILAFDVITNDSIGNIAKPTFFFRKTKYALAIYERAIKLLIINQTKHFVKEKIKSGFEVYHIKPNLSGFKNFDFKKKDDIKYIGYTTTSEFFRINKL